MILGVPKLGSQDQRIKEGSLQFMCPHFCIVRVFLASYLLKNQNHMTMQIGHIILKLIVQLKKRTTCVYRLPLLARQSCNSLMTSMTRNDTVAKKNSINQIPYLTAALWSKTSRVLTQARLLVLIILCLLPTHLKHSLQAVAKTVCL